MPVSTGNVSLKYYRLRDNNRIARLASIESDSQFLSLEYPRIRFRARPRHTARGSKVTSKRSGVTHNDVGFRWIIPGWIGGTRQSRQRRYQVGTVPFPSFLSRQVRRGP